MGSYLFVSAHFTNIKLQIKNKSKKKVKGTIEQLYILGKVGWI